MSNVNLNENEIDKIKVLCDFLMFDHHSHKVTYPRFESCVTPLLKGRTIQLKKVFMDICGKNRKYITYPRLIRAFVAYKANSKEKGLDFKNFFAYFFTEILTTIKDKTGRMTTKTKNLTSGNFQKRGALTNIQVYTNKNNEIQGLHLEYDERYKADFIVDSKVPMSLSVKLDLKLKIVSELEEMDELEEHDMRDIITHVYGTMSTKIEFIGFKTMTGKNYFVGNPNLGKPFLLGKHGTKVHYFKLGVTDTGISYIKPYFFPTVHDNNDFEVAIQDILSADPEEDFFKDEECLKKITNKKDYEEHVLTAIIKDDHFFDHDHEGLGGDDFDDVCSRQSYCDSEEEGENHHHHHSDDEEKFNFSDDEDDKKKKSNNNQNHGDYDEEGKISLQKWDKVSMKNVDLKSLLHNKDELDYFVDRYFTELNSEVEKMRRTKNITQNQKDNFYSRYLGRDEEENSQTFMMNNVRLQLVEDKLDGIMNRHHYVEKKASGKQVIIQVEEEEMGETFYETNKAFSDAKGTKQRWIRFANRIRRQVLLLSIAGSIGAAKAVEHLVSREELTESQFSLDDQLTILDILLRMKNMRSSLNANPDMNTIGLDLIQKKNKVAGKKSEHTITVEKKVEAPKKVEEKKAVGKNDRNKKTEPAVNVKGDLEVVNKKLKALETEIQKNASDGINKEKLNQKFAELKKEKANLKNMEVEQKQQSVLKKADVNVDGLKKEEEERRKKALEDKKEKIKAKKQLDLKKLDSVDIKPAIALSELELPSDTEIYRSQEIVKGQKFDDKNFPPNMNSLCPVDEDGNFIIPPGLDETDIDGWEGFKWARCSEIFRTDNYAVFDQGVEAADIIQGALGDCYFLSAIAGLCKYPKLVQKLFLFKEKSADDTYGIYLRINGLWEMLLLDDFIPCEGSVRKKFAFSNAHGKEMWVVLLEKAWAKLNGSYAKTIAGMPYEVFDAITNAYSENINLSPKMKDKIWASLVDGRDNNFIMTSGTGANPKIDYEGMQLVPGHAYSLLSVEEVSANGVMTKLVKLRNPWGSGEWSGDWSDSSDKWTPQLRKQFNFEDNDDGVFFMSFDDYLNYYVCLSICKIHDDYVYNYTKYKKNDTKKPQVVSVQIAEKTKVYFQLHQKNPRFKLSDGHYHDAQLAFIMLMDENFNYMKSVCADTNNLTIEVTLEPGQYNIYTDINYRYTNPNDLHGYNVTSYSEKPVSFTKNTEINVNTVLESGLISYAKANLTPKATDDSKNFGKGEEVRVYSARGFVKEIPYVFTVFENALKSSNVDISMTAKPSRNPTNKTVFFPEGEFGNLETQTKTLQPGSSGIIMLVRFKIDSTFEYAWDTKIQLSGDALEKHVRENGEESALDEDGTLIQRHIQISNGFGVLIDNKSKNALNLKLMLENMYHEDKNLNEIPFNLGGKSSKLFNLKTLDPNVADSGFSFEFA